MLGLAVGLMLSCQISAFGADTQRAEIRTSLGTILVELDPVSAPRACQAFSSYIQRRAYEGSAFYQVDVEDIQGGRPGPEAIGFSKSGNFFENAPAGEFNLKHLRGAIGLARTVGDCNPTKSSNSTQFYIMRKDFPKDDGNYSIFGHVVQGMDIVDRIAASLVKEKKSPIKFDVVALSASPSK